MTIVARSSAAPRRRSRPALIAALAFVLLGAVIAASQLGSETSTRPGRRATALQSTRDGAARTAVTAFFSLSVSAILDRRRFDAAVARFAAPGFEREVSDAFGTAGAEMAVAFRSGPRVLRAAPLGYRFVSYSPRSASVAIWSVALAASRSFTASAQWRTVVIDVVWTRAGWRVSGGSGTAGPDPSTPLGELAAEASSFRSFTHVP